MKWIKNKIKTKTVFFLLILCGCSPLKEFYINNLSNSNLKVTVVLNRPSLSLEPCIFPKVLSTPSSQDFIKCRDHPWEPTSKNGNVLSFEIPPQRTLFLGSSSIGYELFSELVLESEGKKRVIQVQSYKDEQKYFIVRDSLYSNISYTLNFEGLER